VHLPFVVAGCMALLNGVYGYFVLPESLPPERRRPFEWKRANPVTALRGLAALKGVGALVFVMALSSLAQFMLHMTWVLYTKFRFGWGPGQVGWSLFAVGVASTLSQGFLLRPMLKRFSPQRLAIIAMISGAIAYAAFGLATSAWMVYAVIALNLLGGMGNAAMQGIVSNAADARTQGQTMGAMSSVNSLMAVIAPVLGLEMLRWVSHRPADDWLVGLPLFASSALMMAATVIALRFFRRQKAAAALAPVNPVAP